MNLMSSYANNSFHTIFSSLISHSSLTVCDNVDRDREYLISFLLFPSGIKHRFSIQINIVHTYKINIENYQQTWMPTSQFALWIQLIIRFSMRALMSVLKPCIIQLWVRRGNFQILRFTLRQAILNFSSWPLLKFQSSHPYICIQNVLCKLSNDTLLHELKSDIILLLLWYKSHTLLITFLSWISEEIKIT